MNGNNKTKEDPSKTEKTDEKAETRKMGHTGKEEEVENKRQHSQEETNGIAIVKEKGPKKQYAPQKKIKI